MLLGTWIVGEASDVVIWERSMMGVGREVGVDGDSIGRLPSTTRREERIQMGRGCKCRTKRWPRNRKCWLKVILEGV